MPAPDRRRPITPPPSRPSRQRPATAPGRGGVHPPRTDGPPPKIRSAADEAMEKGMGRGRGSGGGGGGGGGAKPPSSGGGCVVAVLALGAGATVIVDIIRNLVA